MIGSLFRLSLSAGTLVGFSAGILCVLLSYMLIILRKKRFARFVFRDMITIVGLGAILPVLWVKANGLSFNEFGLPGENWLWAILADAILAVCLGIILYSEAKKKGQRPAFSGKYGTIFYLAIGVLFETLFFYSFLRQLFEQALALSPRFC